MSSPRKDCAFSLLELLVAMAVFAMLGLLTVSVISATNQSTSLSNRGIDAASQARLAFDRIAIDLRGVLKRNDVIFQSTNISVGTAGDILRCVSLVASAGVPAADNRNLSVVAYQVGTHAGNSDRLCLLRGAKAIRWNDSGFFGLQSNGLPLPVLPAAFSPVYPADYDVLAAGVIRMVVGFQLYPDNLPVTLADGSSLAASRGQLVYSPPIRTLQPTDGGLPVSSTDISRICAIIVGLVTVDLNALRSATAAQMNDLASAYPVPENNTLPLQAWSAISNDVAASSLSVPLPIRQAQRVFERAFPVTPFGTKEAE